MEGKQNGTAYILRLNIGGVDFLSEARKTGEVMVGWSLARGLLDPTLTWLTFREVVKTTYYPNDTDYVNAGRSAGNLWRFLREVEDQSILIIPSASYYFVACAVGPAWYDESKIVEDSAYRRKVIWLNEGEPIPRNRMRVAFQQRLKSRGTCISANDLTLDVQEALKFSKKGQFPTFETQLSMKLARETLNELRSGVMNDHDFEKVIEKLLVGLGAIETRIIARQLDKGADIVATFVVGRLIRKRLAVQAKHFQAAPAVEPSVIDELVRGMAAEGADFGWVVTSGNFSQESIDYCLRLNEEGNDLYLVDGLLLGQMLVESGISA